LFSGIAGDTIQQVVLCFDWCALGWISHPSVCNLEVIGLNWKAQCGESRMLRLDGGKVVRPYLSVLLTKLCNWGIVT